MQDAQRSYLRFTGQYALVILIVPPEQRGSVQPIGTFGFAGAAVETGFDPFHHFLASGTEILGGRRSAKEQAHPGACVYLDSLRTGHAVPAAAAEITGKLTAVLFHDPFQIGGQLRRFPKIVKKLL